MSWINKFLNNSFNHLSAFRKLHLGAIDSLRFTPIIYAEPLKRKKRMDPALLKIREDRKKKRLEKAVKALEKRGKIFKPLIECEPEPQFLRELKIRRRPRTPLDREEINRRALLNKEWARYKMAQNADFTRATLRLIGSQRRALEELKEVSQELYEEAIKLDQSIFPLSKDGPVHTPPIKGYDCPDGEFVAATKTYIR